MTFSGSSRVCASVSSSVRQRQHHDLPGSGTGKLKRDCAHTASRTSLAQNTLLRAPPLLGFFLPPLCVLTEMTSGIQSTDHWEKEENMPNSRDCSRICWWQGLPVAAWAPPPQPPPSLNKEAKSLGFCRRPLGQGKPGPFILPLSACSCVYTALFSLMHIPRLPLIHILRNVYGNSL